MTSTEVTSSTAAALARMFWLAVGPGILFVLTGIIVSRTTGWLTFSNLAFLAVLAGMIFARWREFQGDNPKTSTGEPATLADVRRYVLGTTFVGLGIWLVANLLRTYWIDG